MSTGTYPANLEELIQIRIETGTPLKWIGNTLTPNEYPYSQFEQGKPLSQSGGITVEEMERLGFVGIYKSII